ncbi:MAG: hypothetical protein ACOVJ8_00155 [Sediminibacterium sp.]
MEKKNKKILLITSAILLIGGGVGYWLWKRKKDFKEEETPMAEQPSATTPSAQTTITPSGTSTSVEDKPANVLAFQRYANSKGWSPRLNDDGIWGPKTRAAWAKWGADFKKSNGVISSGFTKGDKLMVQFPLAKATAYSRQTGKAIGSITNATFGQDSNRNGWFLGTALIPVGNYGTPTSTQVQLQTKDWRKA